MSDIVERLKSLKWMVNCEMRGLIEDTTAHEAAAELAALRAELNAQSIALGDEIIALRAEVERLRADTAAAVEAERAACEAVARHHADDDGPVGLTEYYRGRGIACDEIANAIAARKARQ